jgi:Transposase
VLAIAVAGSMGVEVGYLPGLAMRRIAELYPGEGKTDARDAFVIADAARTLPHTLRRVGPDEETVTALGVLAGYDADLAADLKWLYTRAGCPTCKSSGTRYPSTRSAGHIAEYLVEARPPRPTLTEVWFSPLRCRRHLRRRSPPVRDHPSVAGRGRHHGRPARQRQGREGASAITADSALGAVHRMEWIWAPLTYR